MVEMQFSDFVTCGFNQIVNNLAKIHWRCQAADVVVRDANGGGVGAVTQPKHRSVVLPRARIEDCVPSTPADAKGLCAWHRRPQPCLVFRAQVPLPEPDWARAEEDYCGVWGGTRGLRGPRRHDHHLRPGRAMGGAGARRASGMERRSHRLAHALPWDELVMQSVQNHKALVPTKTR